ncbi:MAG: PQQ-like beta-propeller repeat protein, partial [Verrucomicrobia bacterium]|nr:PQQ-like beta-propeller repeat protein [Verrucomicrobiota bacterium]
IETNWIDHPPKIVWKRPVGEGYSGCVGDQEFIYTMSQSLEDPGLESAICLNFWDGSLVWEKSFSGRYESGLGGAGPRATPLISGQFGYFQGALGQFHCLNLQDGSVHWTVDFRGQFGAGLPEWGFAGSPLMYKEGLIVAVGAHESNQSLGCFHKDSGELMWAVGENPISWSSPTILQLNGQDVLAFMDSKSVQLRDPEDGRLLTSIPWGLGAPQIPMPVVVGNNRLAVSAGYSVGTGLFELEKTADSADWNVVEIWKNHRMKSKFSPILTVGDTYLVGLNDGTLVTLDIHSGQRLFQGERYGHGQLLWVNDTSLIIQNEQGAIVLLQLLSGGHWEELSQFDVLESKTWNPPAWIGNHLVLRNHRMMALVSLPTKSPDQP